MLRKHSIALAVTLGICTAISQPALAANHKSDADEQALGIGDWETDAVFTVDEKVTGYRPVGILDGMGAIRKNNQQVDAYVNHELGANVGYAYSLENGTTMTGARISVFTFDAKADAEDLGTIKKIKPAYNKVYDREGLIVTHPSQINESGHPTDGFNRFCSANIFQKGEFNLEDSLFVTNEETSKAYGHPHGGSYWILDIHKKALWGAPDLGRGTWESATFVDPGVDDKVAMILGDDFEAAPLYLYIGEKQDNGNFLERNGLSGGQLFVWVSDDGYRSPEDWNGTGTTASGKFVPISATGVAGDCPVDGVDSQGYYDDTCLRGIATGNEGDGGLEAFKFSRPEDVATNPEDGTEVIMASTGRGGLFPSDNWGTTYVLSLIHISEPTRPAPLSRMPSSA